MRYEIHCRYDALVKPESLKEHRLNRNKHPEDQIQRLGKLFRYHGIRHPIIVDADDQKTIIAGRGRQLSAIAEGIQEFPVVYQKFESDDHKYAFIQADNAIASWAELDLAGINTDVIDLGPDFDIDMLGLKDFVLEPAEKFEAQSDEDEVPEHVEPKARLGDIYQLGRHRLMCGDSTSVDAVEELMNGDLADACLTDPPYGISYQSNFRDEKFEKLKNDDVILTDWIPLASAFTKGWIVFFVGWQRMKEWLDAGSAIGELTNILVWRKSAAMGDLTGSFAPTYEMALAYNRGSKLATSSRPSAVIEENIDASSEFDHPTQKPIALAEKILANLPGNKVLDLFGGSGWTCITCEKMGKTSYTMELDPKYVDVIIARWEKYTGQKAELINGET